MQGDGHDGGRHHRRRRGRSPGFDRMHPVGELLKVLPECDHLVLLTPYSPATHQMIDAKVFAAMKPTRLSRQSRARRRGRRGCADRGAARARRSRGAALDVFNQEPLPPDHPLWTLQERHHHHPPGRLLRHLSGSRHADPGAQHALLPQGRPQGHDERRAAGGVASRRSKQHGEPEHLEKLPAGPARRHRARRQQRRQGADRRGRRPTTRAPRADPP